MKHIRCFAYLVILFTAPCLIAMDIEMQREEASSLIEKNSETSSAGLQMFTVATTGTFSAAALTACYTLARHCPSNSTIACTVAPSILGVIGFPLAVATLIIGTRLLVKGWCRNCSDSNE